MPQTFTIDEVLAGQRAPGGMSVDEILAAPERKSMSIDEVLASPDFPAPPGTPPPPHSIPAGLEQPPLNQPMTVEEVAELTGLSPQQVRSRLKDSLEGVDPGGAPPPGGATISALPERGFFGRLKESALGGREGETFLSDITSGRILREGFSGQVEGSLGREPIVRPEVLVEKPGFAKGVLRGLGEFTRPDSILMLGALGGITGAVRQLGLPFIERLIAAGFSADMIKGMYDRVPEFKEAADAGDTARVMELAGELVVPGAFAAATALHATKGTRLRAPLEEKPIPLLLERPTAKPVAEKPQAARAAPPEPTPAPEVAPRAVEPPPQPFPIEAKAVPGKAPLPGEVGKMRTEDILLAPETFQFRLEKRQSLKGPFDPQLSKVIDVWTDPVDGKTYAVNGHHRRQLAGQENVPEMNVISLVAKDAKEAYAAGALSNIVDGNATALDAGKFFRGTGKTESEALAERIPLSEGKMREGVALSRLHEFWWNKVVLGKEPIDRAVLIGEATGRVSSQDAIFKSIHDREAQGKRVTNDMLAEVIHFTLGSPEVRAVQEGLFGKTETVTPLTWEKAAVSNFVRKQLSSEKNIFGALKTERKAGILARAGNVIETGANAEIANLAASDLAIYDKFKGTAGPINDILNQAAERLAKGESADAVKQEAFQAIRPELQRALAGGGAEISGPRTETPGSEPPVSTSAPTLFGETKLGGNTLTSGFDPIEGVKAVRKLASDILPPPARVLDPATQRILSRIKTDIPKGQRNIWDRFYTATVDKLHPLRRAVEGLAEGKPGPQTEQNAYQLARLHAGWAGKADHFLRRGTFDADTLEITGKPLQEILKPLAQRLDEFGAYLTSKRAIEKEGQKIETGFDIEDARRTVEIYDKEPAFAEAAAELQTYQSSLLDYLQKSGFFSKEQMTQIQELNNSYVPFYRFVEGTFEKQGPATGKGKQFANLPQPVRRMKGSEKPILDPLESIVKNTYAFIDIADRQRVSQVLVEQSKTSPNAEGWLRKVPAGTRPTKFELREIKKVLEEAGVSEVGELNLETIATVFRPAKPSGENIIHVFENGKRNYYEVNRELFRAMTSMGAESFSPLIKILSIPSRVLRLGATGVGPEFVIRNPLRDTQTAFLQSGHGFRPFIDTFGKGLFDVVGRGDLYGEWQRGGGQSAALISLDRKHVQRELNELVKSRSARIAAPLGKLLRGKPGEAAKAAAGLHPVEFARSFSEAMEAATRTGEFRRARKAGETIRSSAFAAREVSLDFARIGASTRAVNQISAFWNASVQGVDKMARVHMQNPKKALVKGVAGVTLPTTLLYLVNRDDPAYQEQPQWLKDFSFLIPTPGHMRFRLGMDEEDASITPFVPIPIPFDWGLIYKVIPERMMTWIDKRDPQAFDELSLSLAQNLPFPVSAVAGQAQGFEPTEIIPPITSVVPIFELFGNRSTFTGRAIDSEKSFPGARPAPFRVKPWTSEIAKQSSRWLFDNGVKASPVELEHLLFGYTAGGGRAALAIADLPFQEERSTEVSSIPGLRAFVVRHPSTSAISITRFFDRLGELEEKKRFIEASPDNEVVPPDKRFSQAELDELDTLTVAKEMLAERRKQIEQIENSELSAETKKKRIDEIIFEQIDIARNANKLRSGR